MRQPESGMQVIDKNYLMGHQKTGLERSSEGGKTCAVVPKTHDARLSYVSAVPKSETRCHVYSEEACVQ
jgi:hypothetical protein